MHLAQKAVSKWWPPQDTEDSSHSPDIPLRDSGRRTQAEGSPDHMPLRPWRKTLLSSGPGGLFPQQVGVGGSEYTVCKARAHKVPHPKQMLVLAGVTLQQTEVFLQASERRNAHGRGPPAPGEGRAVTQQPHTENPTKAATHTVLGADNRRP